jgi:hypothetical protein
MNQPFPDKPIELAIDAQQWRREIQTFKVATNQALHAIAAELGNECSAVAAPENTGSTIQHAPENVERQSANPSDFEPAESTGRERLADLKSQLAKRISKSE